MNEPHHDQEGGELLNFPLGDALGDDASLFRSLVKIEETLKEEAPGTAGHHVWDLMALAKMAWPKVSACASLIWTVTLRFSGEERKRIVAESEAREREILAVARANEINAQAEKLKAEAAQGLAVADEMRAQTRRKDDILKKVCSRTMDWSAEIDEESQQLRIFATKKKLTDQS